MDNYFTFVEKHDEVSAQALLENWEKRENVRYAMPLSLEARWNAFIAATEPQAQQMAA